MIKCHKMIEQATTDRKLVPDLSEKSIKRSSSAVGRPRLGEVVVTREEIADRNRELAKEIEDYCARSHVGELVLVPIMTGSMVFVADLMRELSLPVRLAMMVVSNYPGQSTKARGVRILYDLQEDVAGKDVLIVDDILETGQTLSAVVQIMKERAARSVKVCVLLEKELGVPGCMKPDFVGFRIPDKFVVGYGLDYDNLFRNYPQIAVLEA